LAGVVEAIFWKNTEVRGDFTKTESLE
jgi:hypothetical protein